MAATNQETLLTFLLICWNTRLWVNAANSKFVSGVFRGL